MNTKNIAILAVVVLLILGGMYFFTKRSSAPSFPVESSNTVPAVSENKNSIPKSTSVEVPRTTHAVAIQNFSFSPSLITVKKGDSVVWTNKDSVGHTVTSDTGDFDSSILSKNESYDRAFDTVGTFTYHCTPHPSMKGTIVVTE